MENREEKIYLGNVKEKERRNGDKFLTGLICLDDIDAVQLKDHIFVGKNGKRFLRIIINPYREGVNQFGHTHSIAVDTFKPDTQRGGNDSGSRNGRYNDNYSNGSDRNSRNSGNGGGNWGGNNSEDYDRYNY